MEAAQSLSYPINDFFNWNRLGELVLQPKFQRRDVWSEKARTYLIDTILRQLPIPKIYIRQKIDLEKRTTIREVVDGQQRLKAVLDFLNDEFPVSNIHNSDYSNKYFSELPDDIQKQFLSYTFSVDLLERASDVDVLNVFSRINYYTIVLSAQEKLNANYNGRFKQCAFKLGHEHHQFWLDNKILSDKKIARMLDAELASELIVAMLDGLQDKKKKLDHYYEKHDEEFPEEKRITREFREIIDLIAEIFQGNISKTRFRRIPLFYSLFCVLYDARYGLPNSDWPRLKFTRSEIGSIREGIIMLDNDIRKDPPPTYLVDFEKVLRGATTDLTSRRIRHDIIWGQLAISNIESV